MFPISVGSFKKGSLRRSTLGIRATIDAPGTIITSNNHDPGTGSCLNEFKSARPMILTADIFELK